MSRYWREPKAISSESICLPPRYGKSLQTDLAALSSWSLPWKERSQKKCGKKIKTEILISKDVRAIFSFAQEIPY